MDEDIQRLGKSDLMRMEEVIIQKMNSCKVNLEVLLMMDQKEEREGWDVLT